MKGKTVIVTGASRGIGKATADLFRASGVDLFTPDRERLDVTKQEEWAKFAAFVRRHARTEVYCLVNCAGGLDYNAIDSEDDSFGFLSAVISGVWNGIRAVTPLMVPGSSIVNVSSIFAHGAGRGHAAAYQAGKAAISHLTKNAAVRLAPKGIRVNAVSPGFIDTRMTESFYTSTVYRKYVLDRTPLARLGRPEEVANAIVFLASPLASFITGADLPVDGGWLAT